MRRPDLRTTDRHPELSQHFLREAGVARALVRRLAFPPGAFVIEPGAGDGALTEALADAGYRVLAVEKDERLYAALRHRFAGRDAVECRRGDFLTLPLPRTPHRVVSNVPYAITAALVRKLLDAPRPPVEAALIVQREAAEKFAGAPRETRFSLLHKPWFEIRIECGVPRRCFEPPPRVRSVLMRVRPRAAPLVEASSAATYRRFIVEAFGQGGAEASRGLRRFVTARQLARLRHDLGFAADARPSELAFSQWLAIFRFVEHECLGHDPTGRAGAVSRQLSAVSMTWEGGGGMRDAEGTVHRGVIRRPRRELGAACCAPTTPVTTRSFSARRRAGGGSCGRASA